MSTEADRARSYLWDLQAQVADARGQRGLADKSSKPRYVRKVVKGLLPEAGRARRNRAVEKFFSTPEHWPPRGPDEPFEDYRTIHALADLLEKRMSGPFTRPVLGTLATGEINAVTLLVPGTRTHLIVFEDQMVRFAHLFSKAVMLATPLEETEDGGHRFDLLWEADKVRRHLQKSPESVRRFREAVLAYLLQGEPGMAPQYFAPRPVNLAAVMLMRGMELFVLGHEYGHVLAGHLTDGETPRRLLGSVEGELTEVTWEWEQEHVADLIGWNLAVSTLMEEGFGMAMSHAGVELFFCASEVLERAQALLVTGQSEPVHISRTHPPTADRRAAVARHLLAELDEMEANEEDSTDEEVQNHADGVVKQALAIKETVEILWEHTAPVILDLHQRGVQPDARWTTNFSNS